MRILACFVVLLLAALANFAVWSGFHQPRTVQPDGPGMLKSASFAPYRTGQSPLTQTYPSRDQMDEDLKVMSHITNSVRTYTSREGMENVPVLARKYGMTVTQSAWLGTTLKTNELEVEALIAQANANPDTIKRVIVGNEVLLRKDLTSKQLIDYIRRVRQGIRQPVSYADVWAFWLKYPEVADEVDYITIHILPYWEDEPVALADVEGHIMKIYRIIQERFPGKPILIGESGWPTEGRNRGPATTGIEQGAEFVRRFAVLAEKEGLDYNLIEGFDQPWKSALEGTVGARWGIYDADREPKFPLSGPVSPSAGWLTRAAVSVLLASAVCLAYMRRFNAMGVAGVLALAVLAQILAVGVVEGSVAAWQLAFSVWAKIWAVARIMASAAFAAAIIDTAARFLARDTANLRPWSAGLGDNLATLYGFSAIVASGLIAFDGRYRDIPVTDFLVPAFGLTAYIVIRRLFGQGQGLVRAAAFSTLFLGGSPDDPMRLKAEKAILWGLALSVAAVFFGEGWGLMRGEDFTLMHPSLSEQVPLLFGYLAANKEIHLWAAMLLIMALPFLADLKAAKRQG